MAVKFISLDIQKWFSQNLDISGVFPICDVHAINGRFKPKVDEICDRKEISLYKKTELEIDEFETFSLLDIALPELIESDFWQQKFPELRWRKQTINLVKPLQIPRDALDIRREKPLFSEKKYSDIFTRKLHFQAKMKKNYRHLRIFWNRRKKPIIWAISMMFLFLVPTIFYIKFSLENGYNLLLSLANAKNIVEVQEKIRESKNNFDRASFLFTPFSWIPWETVDLVNRATNGGKNIAHSLDMLVNLLPKTENDFSIKIIQNEQNSLYRGNSKDIFFMENLWVDLPTKFLSENNEIIVTAFSDLQKAGDIYKNVSGDSKYAKIMRQVGETIYNLDPFLANYKENSSILLEMLGHKTPQRYIIFNQNRDEIRANGGFPGSIISFTMYKGNILDYRTDDVYYYDWNLYPHKETPPPGIALLTNNYGLRDVNYYPDFLQTIEKANAFIERSGDSTITTGIAINQGMIEEILAVIGDVEVEWVPVKFSSKNFSLLMSLLVENKFAKEKTPKDILIHFINAFTKQMLQSRKIAEVSEVIKNNWERGEILIASRNENIENFLTKIQKKLPWNDNSKNWIYPVFTSVSGNKSDRYISRSIETKIKNLGNCEYETSVNLTFEHQYNENDAKELENLINIFGLENSAEREKMRFIQGNGKNQSFVRLYVPKWALLSWSGADVNEDENATIFSFSLDTDVGAKTSKTLSYKQNIPNCSDYYGEIEIYRQPWLKNLLMP